MTPLRSIGVFINVVILFLFLQAVAWAQTNEGNEFWFGFMEHVDKNQNSKVVMITSKTDATGLVSIPNLGWSTSFSVQANNVTIINLPEYTEFIGSEFVDDNGVLVTSQKPVSVYIHQYSNFRSEATVVLPVESIGNEYYLMAYNGISFQGTIYPSELLIVATENETLVTITVSDETQGGLPKGGIKNVVLNRGETYQIQSRATAPN